MKNKFIFGGIDSSDYDIWLTGANTFQAPARDVEYVSVPGRNGDLIIDNGRWQNVELTYPANIAQDFDRNMELFRSAMGRKRGYQRLEDTYHPDEFRMAAFTEGIAPEMIPRNAGGDFNLTFNCKPQRFLKSGERAIQIMPPVVMTDGMTMCTNYIPAVGSSEIKIFVHCAPEDTLTLTVVRYDASGTEIGRSANAATNGLFYMYAVNNQWKYFRIFVTGYSSASKLRLDVGAVTMYNGRRIKIDAMFGRAWQITNPTRYKSKPMFEVYGKRMPDFTLTNFVDGNQEGQCDWYVINTGVTHFWMDCDMQYVYNDAHNNLTSKLVFDSDDNSLVFPEFGEDLIVLNMFTTIQPQFDAYDIDLGLVCIYPKWWRL